jgi:DNA-binding NarL/FixJ family response regulator
MLAGVRLALEADGIAVCAEATSLHGLVAALRRCNPDLCLLDARFRGGGLQALAEVSASNPHLPVVLLADDLSEEEFLDAMRLGAAGYVFKTIEPQRLATVVRATLAGEAAIPRSLVPALISQFRRRPLQLRVRRGDVDLTAREWDVLDFLRDGLTTREMSERLFISDVTVRRHISSVLKKLRVDSRAQALELLQSA